MRARNIVLVGLFFTMLAAIYTWPLVLHFRTAIYGIWGGKYGGDVFASIHSYWWAKYAWGSSLPLYQNTSIAYPFGVEGAQVFGLRAPGEILMGALLARFVNEIFAYNILIFLSFVLSGLTTYVLVHYITKSHVAAIASGVIFAFSPYHLYVSLGWVELSQIQWIPLYFFCLIKSSERGGYTWGILSGLVLALISFTTLYYGYFIIVMTLVFLCFKIIHDLQMRGKLDYVSLKGLFFGTGSSLVIIAVGLYNHLSSRTLFQNPYDVYPLADVIVRSSRPLDFLLPSIDHPVFGSLVRNFLDARILPTHDVMDLFVGYTPLILAFFGVVIRFRKKSNDGAPNFHSSLFVVILISALVLSFPPLVKIGRNLTIYMPSYLLYLAAPMFKSIARFGVIVMLAISVLAGIGLKYILGTRANWIKTAVVLSISIGLILFEFQNSNMSYAVRSYKVPKVYSWLASQPGGFAIAEYPALANLDYRNLYYKFFQRIHEKPMMNGAPDRSKEDAIRISAANLTTPGVPKMLNSLGIKYVVVHKDFYQGLDIPDIYPPLAVEGLRLVKQFDKERVYEVRSRSSPVIILPFEHFYAPERDKNGKLWRWLRDSATINFFNTTEASIAARVTFKAKSFGTNRWLNMSYAKELLQKEIQVSDADPLELSLSLSPGSNFVRFYVDSKPDTLISESGNKDVSVCIGDLEITTGQGYVYEDR